MAHVQVGTPMRIICLLKDGPSYRNPKVVYGFAIFGFMKLGRFYIPIM